MRLATLAEYRKMVYVDGSAPTMRTLRKHIREIPGGRVEFGKYYVDLDAANGLPRAIPKPRPNPLLKGLL